MNNKRVERIWRRAGLKVPRKQPWHGRLLLNEHSCVTLRRERKDYVWAFDFGTARTRDGRAFKMLTAVDEFTTEYMDIDAARRLSSDDLLERLTWLFATRGVPDHIRGDNGPEFRQRKVGTGWAGSASRR